jgi:2-polyprenyl-3-methyl-5-hydroxy-6-metoxy-1,4-benzoquinol methylase
MRPCPICGNSTALVYWHKTPNIYCPVCTFVYVNKIPDLHALEQTYSENYFTGNVAYRDYKADKSGLQRNFDQRIEVLKRFKSQGELFEVGCAFGFFLERASQYWRVRGIDISPTAVQYAQNALHLDVQRSDFEHFPLPTNAFDLIVMWDVIEHLAEPILAIAKCREALRLDGMIALTTGDIGALVPRLQKQVWRMIIPEHLYFFSRQSITKLLEDNGFELVYLSHPGNYRSLSQLAHILTWKREDKGWRGTILNAIENSPLSHWGIYLNLYDIMFVIARKK